VQFEIRPWNRFRVFVFVCNHNTLYTFKSGNIEFEMIQLESRLRRSRGTKDAVMNLVTWNKFKDNVKIKKPGIKKMK